MNWKKTLLFGGTSLLLVFAVNIAGNYQYYSSGGDWHYSISFITGVSIFSWLASYPTRLLIERIFRKDMNPTVQLLGTMLLLAAQATVVMLGTMKGIIVVFHLEEQSLYSYINNTVYCILFTLIVGLLATSQEFLENLKQASAEKEQAERELMRSQYEALKNQVNPHTLFNSLNTLMVLIPDNPTLAVQFVEEMARVMRYSLQNEDNQSVTVSTELKVAESLLFLSQQRFEGKLIVDIAVDADALQQQIVTHSLLMLVENAIKHNEISTNRPLRIRIYNEAGQYLVVSNTLQPRLQVANSTHIGLDNIKQRYQLAGSKTLIIETTSDSFIVKLPLL